MLYADYIVPESLQEAITVMASQDDRTVIPIAGGTDLITQLIKRETRADVLMDVASLHPLKVLHLDDRRVQIGASVTFREIIESPMIRDAARLLVDACRQIGASQIQNMGTIGGNLANASPAGDTIPCLYSLNAEVSLLSAANERSIPIDDFFFGYRHVDLQPGELIKEISFDALPINTGTAFVKLGQRKAQAISVVSTAVVIEVHEGLIIRASVALGAVAPVIVRSPSAEKVLMGERPNSALFERAGEAARKDISPIDDIRASAEYRRYVTKSLVQKALEIAWKRVEHRALGVEDVV